MRPAFGLHAIHDTPLHTNPAGAATRLAALIADKRWPYPLALIRPTPKPEAPSYPWPSGKVPGAKLAGLAEDTLRSPDTLGIHVVASRSDDTNHAYAHVDAGHADYTGRPDGTAFPFDARLFCRAHESLDAWVELGHDLVTLVAAPNAVIFARPDERHIWSLLYTTGSRRPDAPPDHPHNVNARVAAARRTLGTTAAIRPPEWGTYLSPAHVAAIGRDKLAAAAAVAKNVGPLLYLQCSARAADALSAEALDRRASLAALLAPITV